MRRERSEKELTRERLLPKNNIVSIASHTAEVWEVLHDILYREKTNEWKDSGIH